MSEMNEMKQQMEKYRQRAEDAEAESEKHRQTLGEMIEKIREQDAKKATEAQRRRGAGDSELARSSPDKILDGSHDDQDTEVGEVAIANENALKDDESGGPSRRGGVRDGPSEKQVSTTDLKKGNQALTTRPLNQNDFVLNHGAPAVSILTVVALGVAVMAWLNSYPKVDR